MLTREKLKG